MKVEVPLGGRVPGVPAPEDSGREDEDGQATRRTDREATRVLRRGQRARPAEEVRASVAG